MRILGVFDWTRPLATKQYSQGTPAVDSKEEKKEDLLEHINRFCEWWKPVLVTGGECGSRLRMRGFRRCAQFAKDGRRSAGRGPGFNVVGKRTSARKFSAR